MGAVRGRDLPRQAPPPCHAADSLGALQPRLWLDGSERLHVLPPAPRGASRRPVADRQGLLDDRTLVVDEQGQPVAGGEPGELLVGGSTVMSGYWDEPERNRAVLVRRPAAGGFEDVYFRTGDRVRVLDDGKLAFVARADRQIKVRGYRVELEEVEAALLSLAAVEEAAAFTVPDGEGSSAIRAAVVVGGDGRRLSGTCWPGCAGYCRRTRCPERSPSSTRCRGRRPARSTARRSPGD